MGSHFPHKTALIVYFAIRPSERPIILPLLRLTYKILQDDLPAFVRQIKAVVGVSPQQALLQIRAVILRILGSIQPRIQILKDLRRVHGADALALLRIQKAFALIVSAAAQIPNAKPHAQGRG